MWRCVCVHVFMCGVACRVDRAAVVVRTGYLQRPYALPDCLSLPPVCAHTQTLYTLSTHGSFQTSSGAALKARLQHLGSENTHTRRFHLCLSSDRVSQCLGRKMGLCGAQRLESPKATHQIQLLQSVIPCRASHRSSHFKLHSLSPTSQLWTDGFLFLLHGVPSLKA